MIFNLQILRGIAALGVVFYHTDYRLAGDLHTEFFGVSTFFVISGFIMCFITMDGADDFLIKRLIRIVPLYWLSTIFCALAFRPGEMPDRLFWTLESLFFVPTDRFPILGVGWTLNFEMYFYAVFAVALWINRRAAPLIAAGFVLSVAAANEIWPGHFLLTFYSHSYIMYFPMGIAAFYVWRHLGPMLPTWPTAIIGAALIAFCYGTQFAWPLTMQLLPNFVPYVSYAPAVIVLAALLMSRVGAEVRWRPLILFGDASYALYLTHPIFLEFYRSYANAGWLPAPNLNAISMLFALLCCSTVGVVVHLLIERPLTDMVRRKVRAWRNPPFTPATESAPGSGH